MGHRKLGREAASRKALLRNLVTSLIISERVETSEAKAKELSRVMDKMITSAKKGDLHARREVLAYVMNEDAVTKLFEKLGPRFEDRNGGYTRIIKKGPRRGDGTPMAIVELV